MSSERSNINDLQRFLQIRKNLIAENSSEGFAAPWGPMGHPGAYTPWNYFPEENLLSSILCNPQNRLNERPGVEEGAKSGRSLWKPSKKTRAQARWRAACAASWTPRLKINLDIIEKTYIYMFKISGEVFLTSWGRNESAKSAPSKKDQADHSCKGEYDESFSPASQG